jgi:hypothetical protein
VALTSPNTDTWGGYPEERREIVKFIMGKGVSGVIFLAANGHYAAVSRVPGASQLKEFIAAPLGAPMGKAEGKAKRLEFYDNTSYHYGVARVHAKANPPYVQIELLDDKNKVLYKARIDLS